MTRSILHMLSPLKHMSPFDINMAADAGFDVIVPHTGVGLAEVSGLVQDAIFSRPPQHGARTGVFIAGKKAELALDMLEEAKRSFVPPFRLHVFADPAGSFTTGAALVAVVAKQLREGFGRELAGLKVAIFGGTGVVAYCAAVLVAQRGAEATLVGYDGPDRVRRIAESISERFAVKVGWADGASPEARRAAIRDVQIIMSAAAAGIQVLDRNDLAGLSNLLIVADVNAVPPAGIEGIAPNASGDPLGIGQACGIGALAVGHVKYQTEYGLFKRMLDADTPLVLDFRDAFDLATQIAG
jgi:methylene-tetrahydromethanopterin dehydrogenase